MTWPETTDYNEAVQNPQLNFADAELRQGTVVVNSLGMPIVRGGNFADVYEVRCPSGNSYAVKCFTREVKGLQQRYQAISDHLSQAKLPFAVDFKYLEKGILIKGNWFPLLKMRWVEGLTLNQFVQDHVDEPQVLDQLAQMWVKLAQRLRHAHMAHADLQHGNVLLVSKAAGKLGLFLIDYDGMFVPALAKSKSGEVGHPNFQHPERIANGIYNGEVDRFAHLVIYSSLRILALTGDTLWKDYDNGDNLLFREQDFREPGSSALFHELWKFKDPTIRALAGQLLLACRESLDQVALLEDFASNGKPRELTADQDKQVTKVLKAGATKVQKPATGPATPLAAYKIQPPVITPTPSGPPKLSSSPHAPAAPAPAAPSTRSPKAPPASKPAEWGTAIGGAVAGLVMIVGGIWIGSPFWQATALLTGFVFVSIGLGSAVEIVTKSQKASAAVAMGLIGVVWWAAAWWWLEHMAARIIVGSLAALLFAMGVSEYSAAKAKAAASPPLVPPSWSLGGMIAGIVFFLATGIAGFSFRGCTGPEEALVAENPDDSPNQQSHSKQNGASDQSPRPGDPVPFLSDAGDVRDLAFTPDGKQVLSVTLDGWLRLWNVSDRSQTWEGRLDRAIAPPLPPGAPVEARAAPAAPAGVAFVAISPDGRTVFAGAGSTLAKFNLLVPWSINKDIRELDLPGLLAGTLHSRDDRNSLLYAHTSGVIVNWDWKGQAETRAHIRDGLEKAAFSADGRRAVCVESLKKLSFWDLDNKRELSRNDDPPRGRNVVAMSADGGLALSDHVGDGGGSPIPELAISVWNVVQGRELTRLVGHKQSIYALAFSPSGHRVLSASSDGVIHLWDLTRGASIKTFALREVAAGAQAEQLGPPGQPGPRPGPLVPGGMPDGPGGAMGAGQVPLPTKLAFSPDGRFAVVGCTSGPLRLLTLPAERFTLK